MAKPGVVLRRPVGTGGAFSERAELPRDLVVGAAKGRVPAERKARTAAHKPKTRDERADRRAAAAFELEQKRRREEVKREEAAQQREGKRRDRAIALAEKALEDAERSHRAKLDEIRKARDALDRKIEAEEGRWKRNKEKLETALRRARSPGYLRLV
jgi:hypothetical protein